MKRTFALSLAALAAAALFVGLVHAVLVAAHVSEPAATTVYGLTLRRLWATTAAVLALVGVVVGAALPQKHNPPQQGALSQSVRGYSVRARVGD